MRNSAAGGAVREPGGGAEEKVQHVLGNTDTGHHTGIRAMRHWTGTGEFSGL